GQLWLLRMADSEQLLNGITALIHPGLYSAGTSAMSKLPKHLPLAKSAPWPSVFSGLEVIVNRDTPAHRDSGGAASFYDLLVSLGQKHLAVLKIPDLDAELSYGPGTVVALTGKVLLHEVSSWPGGERYCLAHFMRDSVLNRLGV
ncbi:hypothetical protein BV22DRAFT_995979, partial [Leucogyrophana mollusca]